MSGGYDVHITVTLSNSLTKEVVKTLDAMFLPFFLLATSGAMSGNTISPWLSSIENKVNPSINEKSIEWVLTSCNLDESSLVILSQMLLSIQKECSIKEIKFSRQDGSKTTRQLISNSKELDPYPGLWPEPTFKLDISSDISSSILVQTTFSNPPDKDSQENIEAELFSWAAGIVSGAYAVAPLAPDACLADPEDDVSFFDRFMEWNIDRFSAHPSAINGLINVFVSISENIAALDELHIE
jgi:hypothetical protein